jgi:pSer/pThr/pTyr-binding forkhead associated (FHA) protein
VDAGERAEGQIANPVLIWLAWGADVARLVGRTGAVAGRDYQLSTDMRLGAAKDNDIRLAVEGVSRRHARIVREGDGFWLEDVGATNGTFLNGFRIQREKLRHLDIVTLGRSIDLIFLARENEPPPVPAEDQLIEVKLEMLEGVDAGTMIDVPRGEITLGRAPSCNVVISSRAVGRAHARIERSTSRLFIRDLGSANGTQVNGKQIDRLAVLADGDIVSLGGVRSVAVRVKGKSLPEQGSLERVSDTSSMNQEWKTRFMWGPDELAQIEAARADAIARAMLLQPQANAPAQPAAAKRPVAPAPAKPGAPAVAAKPQAQAKPPGPVKPAAAEGNAAPVKPPAGRAEAAPKIAVPDPSKKESTRPAVAAATSSEEPQPGVKEAEAKPAAAVAPKVGAAAIPQSAPAPSAGPARPSVVADTPAHAEATPLEAAKRVAEAKTPSEVKPVREMKPVPEVKPIAVQKPPVPAKPILPVEPIVVAKPSEAKAGRSPAPAVPPRGQGPDDIPPTMISNHTVRVPPPGRRLRGVTLVGKGAPVRLGLGTFKVGRGIDADVRLDDRQVSRAHAVIVVDGASAAIEDLKTVNGTLVNGKEIKGREQLKSGDTVKFGESEFRIELMQ